MKCFRGCFQEVAYRETTVQASNWRCGIHNEWQKQTTCSSPMHFSFRIVNCELNAIDVRVLIAKINTDLSWQWTVVFKAPSALVIGQLLKRPNTCAWSCCFECARANSNEHGVDSANVPRPYRDPEYQLFDERPTLIVLWNTSLMRISYYKWSAVSVGIFKKKIARVFDLLESAKQAWINLQFSVDFGQFSRFPL